MATKSHTPHGEPANDPVAVAKRIGREYVESDRLPYENGRDTEILYGDIGSLCRQLADRIPVTVVYQSEDPYDDYQDMAETVGSEQMLRVYDQHTDHPFLSEKEQLAFRAVHDWYGHLEADVDFSPAGEFKKWKHMNKYFRGAEKRVMLAEVVGQVGAVHYLKDGFADDRYQQRAFQAPKRWADWMERAIE